MAGLFDFFVNKLDEMNKEKKKSPSGILLPRPVDETVEDKLRSLEIKQIEPFSLVSQPDVANYPGFGLEQGNVRSPELGLIFNPNFSQPLVQKNNRELPLVGSLGQSPRFPSVVGQPQTAAQPKPNVSGQPTGQDADQQVGNDFNSTVREYFTRNLIGALNALNSSRQRYSDLTDLKANPVVNNDKGIKGRLFDIFRQFVISAGQAYGQSQGPPQLRLAEALGAGLAGGTYGGFHPQVDEERRRLYEIQQAANNIESAQSQIQNISKGLQDYSKSYYDILKAHSELAKTEAEIKDWQAKQELAKTQEERALIGLRLDELNKRRWFYLYMLQTAGEIAKQTGENPGLGALASTATEKLLGQLGYTLPDGTRLNPLQGAKSPTEQKAQERWQESSQVDPTTLYKSPVSLSLLKALQNAGGTTFGGQKISINDLPEEYAKFLEGYQAQVMGGDLKDANGNPVSGGFKPFIDEEGNIDFKNLAEAAFVFNLDLSPLKSILSAAGVKPDKNGRVSGQQIIEGIKLYVEDESDKENKARVLSYYINQLPPENRADAVRVASKILQIKNKAERQKALDLFESKLFDKGTNTNKK